MRRARLPIACLAVGISLTACAFLQAPGPTRSSAPRSAGGPPSTAQYVDPVELFNRPEAFVGRAVLLQGEALDVTQNDEVLTATATFPSFTWVRLGARQRGSDITQSIVVEFYPKQPAITVNQCYRLSGTVVGTQEAPATITDAPRRMPRVRGESWEAAPRDGNRCAAP